MTYPQEKKVIHNLSTGGRRQVIHISTRPTTAGFILSLLLNNNGGYKKADKAYSKN